MKRGLGFRVLSILSLRVSTCLKLWIGVLDAPESGRSKLVNRQIGHWNSVIMLITLSVRVVLARQSCQNSSREQVKCSMCRVRIRRFLVMKNNGPQLLGSVMHRSLASWSVIPVTGMIIKEQFEPYNISILLPLTKKRAKF